MLRGNSIVRGVVGLNFQLATYMTSLDAFSTNSLYGTGYKGATKVMYNEPKVYNDYLIYVPHMRIEFINNIATRVITRDVEEYKFNHEGKMVVPTISMFDIYFSGGVISVAPDGSPVQDVYQYVAKKQFRKDVVHTVYEHDRM
jgi:hypothetical protein